jgi:C4-dicarboxylate-specific signal transduction histidine kinase
MVRLRDLPIRRKLRVVMLSTCSAALVVACTFLFAVQFLLFRSDIARDLSATGQIIGLSSSAVLLSGDKTEAARILGSLKARPTILGAAIAFADGRTLASFGDTHVTAGASRDPGLHEDWPRLVCVSPIFSEGRQIGTLQLFADYRAPAAQLFRIYAGLLVIVLTISFLVAVLLSWRLERVILDPIENLADTAHYIAVENDYTVRADKLVDDEVGSFTESFNLMLDRIQQRESALLDAIAERKRAEQELQKLHLQLVDASRQAGMAEVATGVLHNVGNVLNSVNVSATLIAERLQQSRTANLARAAQLLREHQGNLDTYLSTDPKGSLLPAYFSEVGLHLESERAATLAELELLTKNIDHIKDIVVRQQTFARAAGLVEKVQVHDLIEDALRLNVDSLDRHRITIERRFEDVAPAMWDKHQVLQILVNIIRNAKHAIDSAEPEDRRITITLERAGHGRITIGLRDTGMGIAPENLTRIFAHGFTTRRDGHGFGLHTAAIAARELGGSLRAQSDGPGRGATFFLELPLSAPESATAAA